jgi:hypothetical protein
MLPQHDYPDNTPPLRQSHRKSRSQRHDADGGEELHGRSNRLRDELPAQPLLNEEIAPNTSAR